MNSPACGLGGVSHPYKPLHTLIQGAGEIKKVLILNELQLSSCLEVTNGDPRSYMYRIPQCNCAGVLFNGACREISCTSFL